MCAAGASSEGGSGLEKEQKGGSGTRDVGDGWRRRLLRAQGRGIGQRGGQMRRCGEVPPRGSELASCG